MKKAKDDVVTGVASLMIARLEKENKILRDQLAREAIERHKLLDKVFELNQKLIDASAKNFREALISNSNDNLEELTQELEKK